MRKSFHALFHDLRNHIFKFIDRILNLAETLVGFLPFLEGLVEFFQQ